jgi:hypothetical protein
VSHQVERLYGYIDSLVVIQRSGVEENKLPIAPAIVITDRFEQPQVGVVEQRRALFMLQPCSRDQPIPPQVTGDDHVVRKLRRSALDPAKATKRVGTGWPLEFVAVELRQNIVNVENDPGAGQLGQP